MSVRPGLPADRPRVHSLAVKREAARVTACHSRPEPAHSWGIAFPEPCLKGVQVTLNRPSVLAQQNLQTPAVFGLPAKWELPPAGTRSPLTATGLPVFDLLRQHEPDHPKHQRPDDAFVMSTAVAYDGRERVRSLPHRRKGLTPDQIGQRETESHLNEAQALKRIIPDNAGLVAVFRKVPVELISHMRYDECRMMLLFRLIPCEGLRRTRLYDVAAVRDLSTGKLYLVPHRTRCRTVSLS